MTGRFVSWKTSLAKSPLTMAWVRELLCWEWEASSFSLELIEVVFIALHLQSQSRWTPRKI